MLLHLQDLWGSATENLTDTLILCHLGSSYLLLILGLCDGGVRPSVGAIGQLCLSHVIVQFIY